MIGNAARCCSILIGWRLKEPERWQHAVGDASEERKLGSYAELFRDPRWRRNAIVGLIMASSGILGLWSLGFFSTDLIQSVFRKTFTAEGMTEAQIAGGVKYWAGISFIMQNIGAFFGIASFTYLTAYVGRRPAFAVSFIAAGLSTAMVFAYLDTYEEIFWMVPIMGFCQMALFGGYAIYFPELFPTYLRSTGRVSATTWGAWPRRSLDAGRLDQNGLRQPTRAAPLRRLDALRRVRRRSARPALRPETKGKPLPE